MQRHPNVIAAGVFAALSGLVQAEWRQVAPGIGYREWQVEGPVMIYVARGDRARRNWAIDSAIGQGSLKSGRETVSQLAERYDEAVNFRGERYDVKVAINGDYFSFETGQAPGGQIISGWFVKRFGEYSGGSGFVWTADRRCFLGGNVRNSEKRQHAHFADGTQAPLAAINAPRGEGDLVLYTPHYAESTCTSGEGVEVLVRVDKPVGVAAGSDPAIGEVVQVRRQSGSTPLLFDTVVLSGQGEAAELLAEHARVGQPVQIRLGLEDYGTKHTRPAGWGDAYASVGGHFYCVVDGVVPAADWEARRHAGAIKRDPRTAVAMNDDHVYFVVVDGRSSDSIGMTITELGRFCAEHLSAASAIAQDGGGSSALWLDGKIMNVPSDKHERSVANGYIMALVHEPRRSDAFTAEARLRVVKPTEARLGPGTNHRLAGTFPAGQTVTVLASPLNGIQAKGASWWKCRGGELEGWVSEDALTRRGKAEDGP
jgi:hypothetical protein